jgi:hypothetical protein
MYHFSGHIFDLIVIKLGHDDCLINCLDELVSQLSDLGPSWISCFIITEFSLRKYFIHQTDEDLTTVKRLKYLID